MLPKDKRLNLKKDFKWAASGKRLDTKYLKLFFKIGENQSARVGIATSSKNFKKAADRNRARRVTSAVFESLYSSLPPTLNVLALPKASIIDVKSGDVLLDTQAELKKIKVINDSNSH